MKMIKNLNYTPLHFLQIYSILENIWSKLLLLYFLCLGSFCQNCAMFDWFNHVEAGEISCFIVLDVPFEG